jgi:hypothetical protein
MRDIWAEVLEQGVWDIDPDYHRAAEIIPPFGISSVKICYLYLHVEVKSHIAHTEVGRWC